ncbi:hypothetical protein GCM10010329_28050 [Streptomyces spiroverticillatus]|uniref:Uncharacterized protein n=1 Tax=Streptomyces finlayi TaxID=67296 RepID=A0A919C931_9ACTN|nr:Imm49 family immunity protein [Streptomyces finlayi]GHA03920.1 hypothetical protein GCM10010329_28050 [Streptomyces spiroverticillatus]GHC88049.1 hypothetical protein GCM10010334_20460 [Streptomyces finlayi]
MSTQLVVAVDGTCPDSAVHAGQTLMSLVLYPPINSSAAICYLLSAICYLRGDHAQFNQALVDATKWHKSYRGLGDDDMAMDSDGFVALGPLAMA